MASKGSKFTIGGLLFLGVISLFVVGSVIMIISMMMGVGVFETTEEEPETGGAYCEGGEVSKSKIDEVFESNAKGGGLEGKGDYIIKSAKKHKIDPQIFMAIIINETGYGQAEAVKTHNNVAGMMGSGDLFKFDSIEEGIDAAAKNLYDLYFSEGLNTPEKIGKKYAPVGAANDPDDLNSNWIPGVKKTIKQLNDGKASKAKCKASGGKFNDSGKDYKGKIPGWSNSDPGKGNLYTAGQCTWYAYGIRQKMGKPISTFWHDAHKWNERAKAEGYKVGSKPKKGAAWIAEQGAGGHSTVTGHVGIVIDVKSDNEFVVTEMNAAGGPYNVSQRTVKMEDGYSFIY